MSPNLIAAHLVPSDDGPAVLLLYENEAKERISLVVSGESRSRDVGLELAHRDGYTLAYWQEEPTAYTLAGAIEEGEAMIPHPEFRSRGDVS